MEPFSLGLGIVGLGMSLFGSLQQSHLAQQSAQISQQIFGVENQENDVRRQAMELSARRNQTEVIRNTQRMRAAAIQAGVNQGANKGSGLAGGVAEVQDEGGWQLSGIQGNLSFGRQMFGLDSQINSLRAQQASIQSQSATAQGWQSLGRAFISAGPIIGQFGQGFGTNSPRSRSVGDPTVGGLY